MPSLLNGRWEPVYVNNNPIRGVLNSQRTAVHACLVYNPNDDTWKVLYFRGAEPPVETQITTRLWHPPSPSEDVKQITTQTIPGWGNPPSVQLPRLFCGGHAFMHDGRLFVAGGNLGPVEVPFRGLNYAYIFDPRIAIDNAKWSYLGSPGAPKGMQEGRWYPTVTLLSDRRLLVISGYIVGPLPLQPPQPSHFNRVPEIWNPQTDQWIRRIAPQALMPFFALYPGAHVVPRGQYAGKVFYSMPMRQAYVFDPNFDGSIHNGGYYWNPVGNLRQGPVREGGCSVLLPIKPAPSTEAKVLILGGDDHSAQFGTSVATNTAEIINLGASVPNWAFVASMQLERTHANAIILPDGKILVIGGNQISFREGAVTYAELYDTDANAWTLLPPCSYTRMYHSAAILLPDATVWVGGGDTLGGSPSSDFIEIYKPGYLFDGPPPPQGNYLSRQPIILSISSAQIGYNSTFAIATDLPIDTAILISLGATTHAFDQNQRAVWLNVTPSPFINGYTHSVSTPTNANFAPPGYYMFFVLRPKSASTSGTNRIPSVAKFLRLG